MPRYIEADAVIAAVRGRISMPVDNLIVEMIRDIPTISPDEVRREGYITEDDACPVCGCWIPTDDAHDAIFKNEVKFCYYCGTRLRMKGE